MRLERVEVCNLYSYSEKQELLLSPKTSLIVGPNNSGKSNIFRFLDLVIETLMKYPERRWPPTIAFSNERKPYLHIKLNLSKNETEAIISFLSVYNRGTGNYEYFNYANRDVLLELLNIISIQISWEEISVVSQSMRSHLTFIFEKIGLTITQLDDMDLRFAFETRTFRPSLTFMEFLGRVRSAEEFQKDFQNQNVEDVTQVVIMNRLVDASDISDQLQREAMKNIAYFAQGHNYNMTDITFTHLIELILRQKIVSVEWSGLLFSDGTLAYTDSLIDDGNLSSLLYNLKMSPNILKRNRYNRIQQKFKEIFEPEKLSFDVVNNYGEDNPSSQVQIKKEPQTVTICITDMKSRQFSLVARARLSYLVDLLS
jgi:hypothetical protein